MGLGALGKVLHDTRQRSEVAPTVQLVRTHSGARLTPALLGTPASVPSPTLRVEKPDRDVASTIRKIRIPAIAVEAPVVVKGLDAERRMEAPDHPNEVAWYDFTALPGRGSNVVLAGHVDFIGVGPAVFWNLWRLEVGDVIELVLTDGRLFRYQVQRMETVQEDHAPVGQIVGPTPQELLTLITCAGNYNPASGRYDQRLIVQAVPLGENPTR